MKKLLATLSLVAVAAVALPALAGDDGYRCTNACPLAKQANERRSAGTEALTKSETVRKDVAKTVAANLDRI